MAEKIHVSDKEIVVPGELLAEGMSFLPSGKAFRDNDKIYASTVGLISVKGKVVRVIPLSGPYVPNRGDDVIGQVVEIGKYGWSVDLGCPSLVDLGIGEASTHYIDLDKTDLNEIYNIGDHILATVKEITKSKFVKLSTKDPRYHKLESGNLISVAPAKVPRIIGKKGSMIALLKRVTGCKLFVGQNGVVWIDGEPEMVVLVTKVIHIIEKEAHTSGLTDRIEKLLEKEVKGGKKK